MNVKKLRLGDLKVEGFEPVEGEAGTAVMYITDPGPCGDTVNMWVCESFESCPPSHPYQKNCV